MTHLQQARWRVPAILLAFAVLSAAGRASAVPPPTLWDALASGVAAEAPAPIIQPGAPPVVVRHGLGPVPGFTLADTSGGAANDLFFTHKPRRSGIFGAMGDWVDHLERVTGTHVHATGHETLSLQFSSVSGGQGASQTYQSYNYLGQGSNGIYNDTDLTIDATVLKYFHYQTQISNSLFNNPANNRARIDYNSKTLRFQAGDIQAGFQGNSLIDFSRYLSGVMISDAISPHLQSTVLVSQTKAQTHTLEIPGNNSSGPYYVYAGQIVDGSDHVRVDNHDMIRGQDYTLDTYSGELNFLHGQVILQTSTIAITFETYGSTGAEGSIMGMRTVYSPHSGSQVGLTSVSQLQPGGGATQSHTQQFAGYGQPGAVYILDAPLDSSKPYTVTLDGVPLVAGRDFIFNPAYSNQIVMVNTILPTQTVKITYVPLNNSATAGNRSVMGLDGHIGLGKLGSLALESAFSGIAVSGKSIAGHAFQLSGDFNPAHNLHTNVVLRDINPTYTSIESTGFGLNEKSITLDSDYQPTSRLRLTGNWETAQRPNYGSLLTGANPTVSVAGNDQYNQYSLGVNYSLARNSAINYSRTSLATTYAQGGNTDNVQDTLGINATLHQVTLDAELGRNVNDASGGVNLYGGVATTGAASSTGSTVATNSPSLSTAFTKHLGAHWQARHGITLSLGYSDDSISSAASGTATNTDARDAQLNATYSPSSHLHLDYGFDLSDTGNLGTVTPTVAFRNLLHPVAAVAPIDAPHPDQSGGAGGSVYYPGLGGGSGLGYGGTGSYSGYYGSAYAAGAGIGSYGGRSLTNHLNVAYQIAKAMQTSISLDHASSLGSYQYNSTRNSIGFVFSWQPAKQFQLNASYSLMDVLYTGNQGGTNSNTLQFWLQGHPFGRRLGVQLSYQAVLGSSTANLAPSTTGTAAPLTNTSSNLNSIYLHLDYPIATREALFVDVDNNLQTGYEGNLQRDLRVGMDYALSQALKFSLGWQFNTRVNSDPTLKQYNYNANSLLAQFGLHF
ncbi:MAG: hypothetical protein KGJ62_09955 [Armatimonadetes bacterium]|nr:hypothetical protein [Armatimonadota bacterium]MDE2207514.1 hypothetical protein [Armatimonadota bacterium]